jgi:hypothetical protein
MFCVVPLAGGDLYDPRYGAKPFVPWGGRTLIEATLGARPWLASGALKSADIVFVLRALEQTPDILARLRALFPGCGSVVVDRLTAGTVFSALAGAALQRRFDEPLVIDLVDIVYRCPDMAVEQLLAGERVAGIIPWFRSADPAYSYLRIEDRNVIETAEKRVISAHASAGTYFFRNAACFMTAVSDVVAHPERHRLNGNFFVCPVYNRLAQEGWRIAEFEVSDVAAVSKQFHAPAS